MAEGIRSQMGAVVIEGPRVGAGRVTLAAKALAHGFSKAVLTP